MEYPDTENVLQCSTESLSNANMKRPLSGDSLQQTQWKQIDVEKTVAVLEIFKKVNLLRHRDIGHQQISN